VDAPSIDQNGGGSEVAESVDAIAIGKGRSEKLEGGLLIRVKAVVAGLEVCVESCVEAIDVLTNPGTNGNTLVEIKNDIDHISI
jgi:hypothetical protein